MDTDPADTTLEAAHEALRRLYGPHSEDLWQTLLYSAGLTGTETDPGAFRRMASSMQAAGGIVGMCGRALKARADAAAAQPAQAPALETEGHRFIHRPD